MSGFARGQSDQSATVGGRPFRAGRRRAAVLTVAIALAGLLAPLGAGAAGAAITKCCSLGCGVPQQAGRTPPGPSTSNVPACGRTISQAAPTAGNTTPGESSGFTAHLVTTGQFGPVIFATTSTACGVVVSPEGAVSTAGSLPAGSCTVSGTDRDRSHNHGLWTYTLTVSQVRGTIVQRSSTTTKITAPSSGKFTGDLVTVGAHGPVRYITTSRPCGVAVSPSGVITVPRRLAAGRHCTVWGVDTDTIGDSGTWSFTLIVAPATRHQSAETSPARIFLRNRNPL
jgi:hypothetical protein